MCFFSLKYVKSFFSLRLLEFKDTTAGFISNSANNYTRTWYIFYKIHENYLHMMKTIFI